MIDVVTRLLIVAPVWLLALAFLALRRHYSGRGLLYVGAGSGMFLYALAGNPDAGAYIALGALGAVLWLRGTDAEQHRSEVVSGRIVDGA